MTNGRYMLWDKHNGKQIGEKTSDNLNHIRRKAEQLTRHYGRTITVKHVEKTGSEE